MKVRNKPKSTIAVINLDTDLDKVESSRVEEY